MARVVSQLLDAFPNMPFLDCAIDDPVYIQCDKAAVPLDLAVEGNSALSSGYGYL